jgi:hypothetical protein
VDGVAGEAERGVDEDTPACRVEELGGSIEQCGLVQEANLGHVI